MCEELRYCEFKVRHAETANLLKAVFDALVSAVTQFPVPVATVSVYCLQSLMLDKICKCDH